LYTKDEKLAKLVFQSQVCASKMNATIVEVTFYQDYILD
jgi:hypothetical protein